MAACFTTRAQTWCADRESNPDAFARRSQRRLYSSSSIGTNLVRAEGFVPPCGITRCVLSAVRTPVPPRAENLEDGRRIELRVNRFAGGAVSVSLPSSIWWVEQDLNLQARPEQPGYSRLVSPITTSTQIWWAERDSNSHAEAALFESAVYPCFHHRPKI